jgi:hypothetical protein
MVNPDHQVGYRSAAFRSFPIRNYHLPRVSMTGMEMSLPEIHITIQKTIQASECRNDR